MSQENSQKIFRQLERINPSAARSLEEGLEETLTVHRSGIGAVLRRKLATTNPIESCLSTVQRVARNVKRWREGSQPLRGARPGWRNLSISPAGSGRSPFQDNARHHLHNRQSRSHALDRAGTLH